MSAYGRKVLDKFERSMEVSRALSERRHAHRITNMSSTEKEILDLAKEVHYNLDEARLSSAKFDRSNRLARLIMKRKAPTVPILVTLNEHASQLVAQTQPIADTQNPTNGWVYGLKSNISNYYAGKNEGVTLDLLQFRSVGRLYVGSSVQLTDELWSPPQSEFVIDTVRTRITDYDQQGKHDFDPWPTPERADQLHGVLELALAQF